MVKIIFHDNCLCERGTTVALYDYAFYNVKLLKNESFILYKEDDNRNVKTVIEKFKKEFKVIGYKKWNEVSYILKKHNIDIIYMIKAGGNDKKMIDEKICKSVIHCVFNCSYPHGNIYASIAPWVNGNNTKFPFVPHIINLPNTQENLRNKLNIPDNALVFGRHGGFEQFNIKFVQETVYKVAKENPKIYFLFVNTKKFCEDLKNIIHIDMIVDLNEKTKFINSCDAMMWGRSDGEVYSLSQGEFSSKNKPIFTMKIGYLGHVHKLQDKAIWYSNKDDLEKLILNFNKDIECKKDWNAYKDSTPEEVMKKFNEVFIKPLVF